MRIADKEVLQEVIEKPGTWVDIYVAKRLQVLGCVKLTGVTIAGATRVIVTDDGMQAAKDTDNANTLR